MKYITARYVNIMIGCVVLMIITNGCAALGKRLEQPRISLVNIEVKKVTLFETTMKIELRVYNTNDIPLTIKGADCHLSLMGKEFAKGVSSEKTTISALGTAVVSMDVYSSVIEVVKGLMTLPQEESIEYTLAGRLHLEGGAMLPSSIPFKSDGRLSLKDFN